MYIQRTVTKNSDERSPSLFVQALNEDAQAVLALGREFILCLKCYIPTYQGPIICLLYQIATGNSLYPADLLSKKQVLKSLVFQFSYYLIFIFIQTSRNIRNNNKTTMYLPISAYQSPAMELTDDYRSHFYCISIYRR